MYWFIMASYYATFWEWLAIYFQYGVHSTPSRSSEKQEILDAEST